MRAVIALSAWSLALATLCGCVKCDQKTIPTNGEPSNGSTTRICIDISTAQPGGHTCGDVDPDSVAAIQGAAEKLRWFDLAINLLETHFWQIGDMESAAALGALKERRTEASKTLAYFVEASVPPESAVRIYEEIDTIELAIERLAGSPRIGFGLTRATPLLHHEYSVFTDANEVPPPECSRDDVLQHLADWVREDSACLATSITHSSWKQELMEASCVLAAEPNGCEDRYIAWLWVEDDQSSTTDYHLYGYARVARQCSDGSESEADAPSISRGTRWNQGFIDYVAACESPGSD